jgi:hypothetical protein
MDIPAEKPKTEMNRAGVFSAFAQKIRSIGEQFFGFFILSEEERLKAGIDLNGEGRGE